YLYTLTTAETYRGRPGIHTPYKKHEFLCAFPPVDPAIFFSERRSKAGFPRLRDWLDTSNPYPFKCFDQRLCPKVGKPRKEYSGIIVLINFKGGLEQDISSIQTLIHHHGCDTCYSLPFQQRPLYRRCSAVFRQKRGMYIDASSSWQIKYIFRQYFTKGNYDDEFRSIPSEFTVKVLTVDLFSLKHAYTAGKGKFLHRWG